MLDTEEEGWLFYSPLWPLSSSKQRANRLLTSSALPTSDACLPADSKEGSTFTPARHVFCSRKFPLYRRAVLGHFQPVFFKKMLVPIFFFIIEKAASH